MANVVIIGMQWGDEGKGKIVDLICPAFDAVVRYQGGHNAGHTVKFGDRHFSLHLIPSGIVHEGIDCVLGNGMVVNPDALFAELAKLETGGVDATGRLWISQRVPILLDDHARLDRAREEARGGRSIGTTSRGIGPAYETKVSRYGIRACDLASDDLEIRLAEQRSQTGAAAAGDESIAALVARCRAWHGRLAPYLTDTARLLDGWRRDGRRLLFEGAQGALLDVDHGTYPYVTSSNTTAGAAATGSGVPPTAIDGVLGILKAYSTRVGAGPFPTELTDEVGEHLRRRGNEFGTTTGRPRRCGWFDAVAASYATMLNGVDALALTKLDILDDFDQIPVCVAYRIDGVETTHFPADLAALERAEPVLEHLPGWKSSTSGLLEMDGLPPRARAYIRFLEERVGAPVVMVSTGPKREQTILDRDSAVLDRLASGALTEILAARGA